MKIVRINFVNSLFRIQLMEINQSMAIHRSYRNCSNVYYLNITNEDREGLSQDSEITFNMVRIWIDLQYNLQAIPKYCLLKYYIWNRIPFR